MTFRLRGCAFGKSLHNSPAEYLEAFDDRGAARVDPVMQHCKHSSTPIVYGQGAYVGANLGAKWEHQAPFGFAYGICSAFHLPKNQHVVFGLDRRSPLPEARTELTELVARVHLFGTFVQCAALLSIAEATAAKIIANAIRKLGRVSKPQAVVKALRLGLIS
jgi:hypothetical protein